MVHHVLRRESQQSEVMKNENILNIQNTDKHGMTNQTLHGFSNF